MDFSVVTQRRIEIEGLNLKLVGCFFFEGFCLKILYKINLRGIYLVLVIYASLMAFTSYFCF